MWLVECYILKSRSGFTKKQNMLSICRKNYFYSVLPVRKLWIFNFWKVRKYLNPTFSIDRKLKFSLLNDIFSSTRRMPVNVCECTSVPSVLPSDQKITCACVVQIYFLIPSSYQDNQLVVWTDTMRWYLKLGAKHSNVLEGNLSLIMFLIWKNKFCFLVMLSD